MNQKHEKLAAELANQKELVEMLDMVLRPGDQAWVICSYDDCSHHQKGHCSIHTISAPPRLINGKPCASYEKRA